VAVKPKQTLQSIVNGLLEKNAELKGDALLDAVKKVKPDAKEGSIKQAWNIWRKKMGLTKTRSASGRKVKASGMSVDQLKTALSLVQTHFGGKFDKAREQLEALREIGGVDDALEALKELEELRK
jgi:hypothetical protein